MGFIVNHKKVLRLTKKLGVLSFVRPTRKYNLYKEKIENVNVNIKMYKSDKIKMYNYSKLT